MKIFDKKHLNGVKNNQTFSLFIFPNSLDNSSDDINLKIFAKDDLNGVKNNRTFSFFSK